MKNKKTKYVIVRAQVAGVHAGELVSLDTKTCTVVLKNSRILWSYYTADRTGSLNDVAENGLREGKDHSLGPTVKANTTIINPQGLQIIELSKKSWESIRDYK